MLGGGHMKTAWRDVFVAVAGVMMMRRIIGGGIGLYLHARE